MAMRQSRFIFVCFITREFEEDEKSDRLVTVDCITWEEALQYFSSKVRGWKIFFLKFWFKKRLFLDSTESCVSRSFSYQKWTLYEPTRSFIITDSRTNFLQGYFYLTASYSTLNQSTREIHSPFCLLANP